MGVGDWRVVLRTGEVPVDQPRGIASVDEKLVGLERLRADDETGELAVPEMGMGVASSD